MRKEWRWPEHEQWQHKQWRRKGPPHWDRRGGCLFARFLFIFGLMVLLVLGGMAILALLLTRAAGGRDEIALMVWVGGCGLALALPILALAVAGRAYRGITTPLAEVMSAADAVAEGDFGVRVAESERGNQFTRLARSFNRMTAELQRSDQLRRNLTADVAHELRTPLHIIQGNLEGVLDGVYEPSEEHIEATLEETRMLARLVEDLQLLSQAEAGQLSLHMEEVNIPELLADIETSFSGQAAAQGIDLRLDISGEAAELTVLGDVDRLDQAIGNLVVNALRYTPSGGSIVLSAGQQDGRVRIIVADSGAGIPEDDLPYIFERFWRGDASRAHTGGAGAGLGLAIAKQLVDAHQGEIEVTSIPKQGTRFSISLPGSTQPRS